MLEEDPENNHRKLMLEVYQLIVAKAEVQRGKPSTRFVSTNDWLKLQVFKRGVSKSIEYPKRSRLDLGRSTSAALFNEDGRTNIDVVIAEHVRRQCSILREIDAFSAQMRQELHDAIIRNCQATAKEHVDCFP
jgi:hypothetical protein